MNEIPYTTKEKGFLYYACRLGTTGAKEDVPTDLVPQIRRIKGLTHLPVVVGFGISTFIQSSMICTIADGFVVGSFFVNLIAKDTPASELTKLANALQPLGESYAAHA